MAGPGVEDAAEQRAPARTGPAEYDHDQQRERRVGAGRLRGGTAGQQQVDHTTHRGERSGEDEGDQLVPVGPESEHLDPALVLLDALPDPPGRGTDGPVDHEQGEHQVADGDPVEVGGVLDAQQGGGQPVGRCRAALLAARDTAGVPLDEDRTGLREGKGDHGEPDAGDAEADRAEQKGQRDGTGDPEEGGGGEGEPEFQHGEVGGVEAGREVERVAEGEQPGTAEQQVVAGGEAPVEQAEGDELEASGAAERAVEQSRDGKRTVWGDKEQDQQSDRPPA